MKMLAPGDICYAVDGEGTPLRNGSGARREMVLLEYLGPRLLPFWRCRDLRSGEECIFWACSLRPCCRTDEPK
jgi:hypothetical protein